MKYFEYKTFEKKLSVVDLNKLGQQGWELITHSVVITGVRGLQYYVFKRELIIDN